MYGLTAEDGRFDASHGAPARPTATIAAEPGALFGLATGRVTLDHVMKQLRIRGDEAAARRLLETINCAWAPDHSSSLQPAR